MSQIISQVSHAASKVVKAVSILPLAFVEMSQTRYGYVADMGGPIAGISGPVAGGITYAPSVYLLSAASTSVAVFAIYVGGAMYYYETKNIKCKRCKKLVGEKGYIEKCDDCKEEWGNLVVQSDMGVVNKKRESLDVKCVRNAQYIKKLRSKSSN
jgi:hypothetical protein